MFILGNTFKNVKVETSWETYVMIAIYFAILLAIGFYAYKRSTSTLDEYMLGGRDLGALVTALSAGASDMSGWMIMGYQDLYIVSVYQQLGLPLALQLVLGLITYS